MGATGMSTTVQAIRTHGHRSSPPSRVRLKWTASRAPHLLLTIVVTIAAFFASAPRLEANATTPVAVPKFVTPAEARSGALLLRSGEERFVEAPLLGTDVDLVISGPIARARITQIFHNPTDGWVEAVYVYP